MQLCFMEKTIALHFSTRPCTIVMHRVRPYFDAHAVPQNPSCVVPFRIRLPSDAQKDLLDKASVTNPSASFLDVAARRSALATATNPRVVAALKDKWDCTHSEQPAPPTGR